MELDPGLGLGLVGLVSQRREAWDTSHQVWKVPSGWEYTYIGDGGLGVGGGASQTTRTLTTRSGFGSQRGSDWRSKRWEGDGGKCEGEDEGW